jgi:branched-chain amino acid transport system substrate-binding protein
VKVFTVALTLFLLVKGFSGGPGGPVTDGFYSAPRHEQKSSPLRGAAPRTAGGINIGLFAPMDESNPAALSLYRGILLAVESSNREGGFKGMPFRIVRRWANDPWGAGSKEVIKLVYEDNVHAIIGYREGASHIALQVAAKARVPILAPLSTVPSITATGIPWVFRLPPDDNKQAKVIVDKAFMNDAPQGVSIISATDHDSREIAYFLEKEVGKRRKSLLFHFKVAPELLVSDDVIERIAEFKPCSIILCLRSEVLPSLLQRLNRKKEPIDIYLPWVPGLDVKQLQSDYMGKVLMVEPRSLTLSSSVKGFDESFSKQYSKRFGNAPNNASFYGYRAACMIIEAIKRHGLDRVAIGRGLKEKQF